MNRSPRLRRVDEMPVWSLSCFYVRSGYRKQGVTAALVVAALKMAKRAGAPALEAYPVECARDARFLIHRLRSDVLACGLQNGCVPCSAPADHAS